jgi:hypothetical protein
MTDVFVLIETGILRSIDREYPLAHALTAVSNPQHASFSTVLNVLEQWKGEVESTAT